MTVSRCMAQLGALLAEDGLNSEEWADALTAAYREGGIKPVCAARVPGADEAMAYGVQRAVMERLSATSPVVGFKSALTNERARSSFGWPSPMSGVLLAEMEQSADEPVGSAGFHAGVIETEIGLRIGKEISAPVSAASIGDHLEGALPMIELGDVGFAGKPSPLDLIAGNAAASRFIQGALASVPDLARVRVALYRDDQLLHDGHAKDAMGDVMEAGAWLVNDCLARGYRVLPGYLLMTGSLGQIQPMKPGRYDADYGDFGAVEFRVVS